MAIAEFIVSGTPISAQASSRSKACWKADVSNAAFGAVADEHALVADSVRVTIVYFYVSTDLDLDNIIKPILDALIDVIYINDFQVANIAAAKRDLSGRLFLEGVSPEIIRHLGATANEPRDFVFVAVELGNLTTLL
ncbi:MAG: RusA family crossover junction endodeoxyribonuclease [Pyrinomonadaceae bacterium]